jgi:cytidine deaminase
MAGEALIMSYLMHQSQLSPLFQSFVCAYCIGVRFFRGMNVEVSMPTGSLCSERNAIGSALSSDPSLCRKDLRMIAVLAIGLEPFSTTSTLSANLPVPPKLIPLAPTTPHALNLSPMKSHFSPPLPLHFPSLNGGDVTMGGEDGDDKLPAPAAKLNMLRAQSERSVLMTPRVSGKVTAPPSSPLGKPQLSPTSTHPATYAAAAAANVAAESNAATSSNSNSNVTPRKRKATPEPTVHFAPSPSGSVSPPMHTPRLTRHNSLPAPALQSTARSASKYDASPSPTSSPISPHGSPMSPQRTMRSTRASSSNGTGANATATGANSTVTPVKSEPIDSSTTPRSNKRARRGANALDVGVSDSVYADGEVTEEQAAAYVEHELSLVKHRDALLTANHNYHARLSGNLAPNAIAPVDRYPSPSPPPPSADLIAAMQQRSHSASAKELHATLHPYQPHAVTDERNPINPCGACNVRNTHKTITDTLKYSWLCPALVHFLMFLSLLFSFLLFDRNG